ncbi:hypothetical protein [Arenicella xantha]|uniref:Secreted protein n=1 Tax=Arenicella xantha TaxID=644221 RepID=A0A395JJE4_9GAMM|nr:hypothetical protein [Arenicella xantha]RBP50629.1 hypothetical protein DFR28_10240 [Arenicella xantha]
MKTIISRIFLSKSILLLCLTLVASGSALAATDGANGGACIAANQLQSSELQWNHARVINPAGNTRSRFVTCTATTGPQMVAPLGVLNYSIIETGSLYAYFAEGSAPDAEVSCIFREMAVTATTDVANDSVVKTITADGPTPNVTHTTFVALDGLDLMSTTSFTVTCLLPPGTGINAFGVTHSLL